jgi:hypothetical protein
MREVGKYLFSGLAAVAFCSSANLIGAATSGDIYGRIPARNLFGLHDPPPQQQPPPVEPLLPKIVLTGTTTILGKKMAFVKVQSPQKSGQQPQPEQSFILAEGQREGDIEVLEINENAGSVRVKNSGKEMTIAFDKDAGKGAASTPPPNPVGGQNLAGRGINPGLSGYQRMIPTRTGRQVPAIAPPPLPPTTQTPVPAQAQPATPESR